MDLKGITLGHTEALEVEVLRALPDYQDTEIALNYKTYLFIFILYFLQVIEINLGHPPTLITLITLWIAQVLK